mgnify:CR=1 FL=1
MMLQDDFLILKGQGVFLHGHNADMYGNMRALAPSEVEDGVNPFHINPYTGKKFKSEDGYDVRNQYQAMVEEVLYQLTKDNPHIRADPVEQSKIRMDLRKKMNEAARKHNKDTGKDQYENEKGRPHPHRHPEKVFLDTNDTNSVNPVLLSGVFAPEYQKLPIQRHADTGEWDQGPKGDRIDPRYAKIKNQEGVYPDLQHSMVMHDDHGQMSESMFNVIQGEFLHLVKHGSEDGSSNPNGYGDAMSKVPYTISQGHVLPDSLVIYTDPQTGRRSKVWNYRTTGKPGSLGRAPGSRGVLSGMPGGLMSLPDALATIHPIFFQPVHRAANSDRREFARDMLYALTSTKIPEDVVDNFARSPVLYTLWEAKKGFSATRASAGATTRLLQNIRQHALNIPNSQEGWRNDEDKRRYTEAEHNIERIGIEGGLLPGGDELKAGVPNFKEMVYLSVLLRTPGNEEAANIVQHGLPADESSLGWRSPGQVEGGATRDFYRRASSRMGRDHRDFQFTPYDEIPAQENRKAEWEEQVPWAIDQSFTERPKSPFSGLFGTSPEYIENNEGLYTLMESLQSASARMDDLVLKSLPAHRRFHIHDSYDRDELCDFYQVDDRDLYYINETLGDWSMIAKELKVKPVVVKGIKVALRW